MVNILTTICILFTLTGCNDSEFDYNSGLARYKREMDSSTCYRTVQCFNK